jgi:hypothetical protein
MNKNIEIATAPFREGVKEGAAAFGRELKAEWKPLLSLFVAFGLGVTLARFVLPPKAEHHEG